MEDETKTNISTPAEDKAKEVEVDWESKYKETQANLDKVAAERENYKKVALSKKGASGDDEDPDEKMRRIAREEQAASREGQLLREKEEIAERVIKENKELKVALKNRAQVGTSATTGGGQTTTETKVDFWTPDQLAYFAKRGINPEKAKENYLKLKNN